MSGDHDKSQDMSGKSDQNKNKDPIPDNLNNSGLNAIPPAPDLVPGNQVNSGSGAPPTAAPLVMPKCTNVPGNQLSSSSAAPPTAPLIMPDIFLFGEQELVAFWQQMQQQQQTVRREHESRADQNVAANARQLEAIKGRLMHCIHPKEILKNIAWNMNMGALSHHMAKFNQQINVVRTTQTASENFNQDISHGLHTLERHVDNIEAVIHQSIQRIADRLQPLRMVILFYI